jgi:von Willebrand factor type A domain
MGHTRRTESDAGSMGDHSKPQAARSVNPLSRLRSWWTARHRVDDSRWDGDTPAWLLSLLTHLGILVILTLVVISGPTRQKVITVLSSTTTPDDPLAANDVFSYSQTPQDEIGSSSAGLADAKFFLAPSPSITPMPAQLEVDEQPRVTEVVPVQEQIRLATGPNFAEILTVKGAAGVGAVGTGGAVDRITQELLLSLEERPTLVVWLFDASGSLEHQRAEIIKRFDRIYDELGVIEASGNPAFKKHEDKPLLSSVVEFGQNVTFLTPKPTDDVEEIKAAVADIKTDTSGIERTFQAVAQAIERYRTFRAQQPRRNVMLIIFTDEVGNDEADLDHTVTLARRWAIPVYCVGVPAPFGRSEANIKYVDPDPKYDQTPQWVAVRQGPESYLPELVKIGDQGEQPMDSGFGPYSLTRLCYETGGIFFAVHPNRNPGRRISRGETAVLAAHLSYFFDPEVMRNYRPDYVSIKEYKRRLAENKARSALVQAAQFSWIAPMEQPTLVFPKVNDADLAKRLSRAQQAAAVLGPKISQLYEILAQGEKDRPKLTVPRWQAGYDLSMGRVLALMVRTEGYNAMLAKAKQGMKFTNKKNDTWQLVKADEISVSSTLEKQAQQAKTYLERVVRDHPDTPWALVAKTELEEPLGWKWQEIHTGVNAPRQVAGNGKPRQERDDKARMLPRPERRPPPKL